MGINKAKIKPLEIEYVIWKDNLAEMKHFCGDQCVITYESCYLDDYWSLMVNDCINPENSKHDVALGNYVVKLGENCFTVIDSMDFNDIFEKIENNINEQEEKQLPDTAFEPNAENENELNDKNVNVENHTNISYKKSSNYKKILVVVNKILNDTYNDEDKEN